MCLVAEPASFLAIQVYVPMSDDCTNDMCKSPDGKILKRGLYESMGTSLCSQWIAGCGDPSAEQCKTAGCAWVVWYFIGEFSMILGGAKTLKEGILKLEIWITKLCTTIFFYTFHSSTKYYFFGQNEGLKKNDKFIYHWNGFDMSMPKTAFLRV